MGLFYVTPHHTFDVDDLDEDIDTTWFVIADTVRQAAELWIQKFNEFTGLEIAYGGAVNAAWVIEMAEQNRADHVVEIRDLSFDAYAAHGAVPWENILPAHFQIVEV